MLSFIPSIQFIDSGNYIYDEQDKYNLGPFTAPSVSDLTYFATNLNYLLEIYWKLSVCFVNIYSHSSENNKRNSSIGDEINFQ